MSDFLPKTEVNVPAGKELATFGAGCFWCIEAVFQRVKGVESVVSGYSGGFVHTVKYAMVLLAMLKFCKLFLIQKL